MVTRVKIAGSLLTVLALVQPARAADTFPDKPIRVVIPQLAGGTADTVLRLYAEKMGEILGQRIVVDNRAGSGVASITALQLVAGASPDGHTLLLVVPSFTFSPAIVKDMPVDVAKDFAPVTLLNRDPYLVTVYPALPAHSVAELEALAKAKPGSLSAGAGNFGSGTYLVTMSFLDAIGVRELSTYVPYKSMTGAFVDVIAGRSQIAVSSIVSAWTFVKAGRLRALAVTGATRSEGLPDTPTVAEQGIAGFEAIAWNGLVAPAKTPAARIQKLSGAAAQAARMHEVRDRLKVQGSEAIGSTPAEFRQLIGKEITRWRELVAKLGIAPG